MTATSLKNIKELANSNNMRS